MIDARDLRIGNIITDGVISPCVIIEITAKGVYCRYTQKLESKKKFWLPFYYLVPLELTEEWLVRLGAIEVMLSTYKQYNLFGIKLSYINGMWIEYVHQIEIRGVHHLQNLYHSLTGQELEMK
jgi:hypothetical protein